MSEPASTTGEAWYRNGWVWLVIGIPAATVAGCCLTIWLALAHPDERVREPATVHELRNP